MVNTLSIYSRHSIRGDTESELSVASFRAAQNVSVPLSRISDDDDDDYAAPIFSVSLSAADPSVHQPNTRRTPQPLEDRPQPEDTIKVSPVRRSSLADGAVKKHNIFKPTLTAKSESQTKIALHAISPEPNEEVYSDEEFFELDSNPLSNGFQ